jgi:CRP-like cAMP-binding protein
MDFVQPESSARYAVRYWLTDLARDDPTSSLVRARIFSALRRAKIPLAVPAATLFLENKDDEAIERKAERKLHRRLEAVQRMPLCQALNSNEQELVARRLKFSPYAAGEVISREGAPAHWLYILDKGQVEIRINYGGQEVTVSNLSAPDYFGEHGMLTGAPRTATVVATSEVECFRLDRSTFHDVLQSRPEVADHMASVLAQRQEALSKLPESLQDSGDRISRADRHLQILGRMQEFFGLSGK